MEAVPYVASLRNRIVGKMERTRVIAVPLTFFVLAGALWPNRAKFTDPTPPGVVVPVWATSIDPIRRPRLAPLVRVGAFDYRCMECHGLFVSVSDGWVRSSLNQHRHIELKHGINDNCYNCHDRENRDLYVGNQGVPIPADQPQMLCAKCHGLVYRDWLQGAHGRTDGYWSEEFGPLDRKKCIQCHDPHVPPFPPMRPAPGPNTLRMGDQEDHAHTGKGALNPLLIHARMRESEGGEAR